MSKYITGGTLILKAVTIKDGVAYDPVTSTKIAVYDKDNTAKTDDGVAPPNNSAFVAMTPTSTGHYSYNLNTSGFTAGKYRARVKTADGTKITYKDYSFELEL